MKSFKFILLFFAAIYPLESVHGILDVTKVIRKYSQDKDKKSEKDSSPFAFNVKISGSSESGSTEKSSLSGATLFAYRAEQDVYIAMAETSYGESLKIVDKRTSLAHLRWIHSIGNKYYLETYYQVQSDTFRRLVLRSLFGMGLRYDFFTSKERSLLFGFSAFYSEEDQKEIAGFTDDGLEVKVRFSSYINSSFALTDSLSLDATIYFQPVWNEMADHRISGKLALDNKLTESLSFESAFSISHDNEPPQGVNPTDTKTTLGLKYSY